MDITIGSGPIDAGSIPAGRAIFDDSCYHLFFMEVFMKENKYDDPVFFEKYSQMERSKKGLEGAGEWYELKKLIPDL